MPTVSNPTIHVLDLGFQGSNHAIAAFLLIGEDGPVLIETGPHSCFSNLEQKVHEVGYGLDQIQRVFLTHIHLDHGGAAWAMAEKGATIYVHPAGSRHLIDPSRLLNSAKRIYQDQMETLWGDLKPIDPSQVIEVEDGESFEVHGHSLEAMHTPGHAVHHIAWKLGDSVFCGDIAGVMIDQGPVVPPCPPPDINLEQWFESIDRIIDLNPVTIYLTHFGAVPYSVVHMEQLKETLDSWSQWIYGKWKGGMGMDEATPLFQEFTDNELLKLGLDPVLIEKYQLANPAWMSVAGLYRYWSKKMEE